ncbi:MAG TPA: FAD-binding oxidoreductase [Pseudonocardiaceae bacterium]
MSARSWWGWGTTARALGDEECAGLAALLGVTDAAPLPPPAVPGLPDPRLRLPDALRPLASVADEDRAAHAHGKAYRDVLRNLRGELAHPPDAVLRPRSERDVVDVLDWATGGGTPVVPYGGGSSVVGGVEYRGEAPWVSLDLGLLAGVAEVDATSRAVRVRAGTYGPALEDALRPHGVTLRHFPQSFEFSTVGGWLATRAGGHYATLHTHIDDAVESLRVVTPAGVSESWRLPASGAGPSPDRLFLGSEGTLGVITEAWLRVRDRPEHRAGATVGFPDLARGLAAVRAIAASGLYPANCRLLDAGEAALGGASASGETVLVLGFESAHAPVAAALELAVGLARDHGGTPHERGDAAGAWRAAFLRMPYVRDGLARAGVLAETFETACTWDRLPELCDRVRAELGAALPGGVVNCRLTHAYPDGAAPYFTVLAPARRGGEVAQWDDLKAAAGELLHAAGATVTHHHAVGRDHRPWYDRQRPEPFATALRAAKAALDPAGVLNPGVLID